MPAKTMNAETLIAFDKVESGAFAQEQCAIKSAGESIRAWKHEDKYLAYRIYVNSLVQLFSNTKNKNLNELAEIERPEIVHKGARLAQPLAFNSKS